MTGFWEASEASLAIDALTLNSIWPPRDRPGTVVLDYVGLGLGMQFRLCKILCVLSYRCVANDEYGRPMQASSC